MQLNNKVGLIKGIFILSALYRKPHGSPFQQTLLMGSTDEFNPKAASFDINALRLGTTGIDNHSIHAGESQSQIEPDNLLAPLFFESNIPESVPNVELFRVSVSPCPLQRARYEDECSKGNRFIFVPYDGILTIKVSSHYSNIYIYHLCL